MSSLPDPAQITVMGPRQVQEHVFRAHDGAEIFYRYWPARSGRPRGAILLFHRGHEHSGRMQHLAHELGLPDFAVFAWDARGHGRSSSVRGHSATFATSVRDVQTFVDHVSTVYDIPIEGMVAVAQSVGAVLVATWVHDYAPKIRAMVLASPAFRVKLYIPFARAGLRLLKTVRGDFFVNSYVKARFLTHDPVRRASYNADPLITRPIAVSILLGLQEAADRVVGDARAITVPTQLLVSGADWVVDHAPQHRFFERLGSPLKQRHIVPGFFHDTLGERDREALIGKVREFILGRFDEAPVRPSVVDADRTGFTREEADRLASPLPALSGRRLYWGAVRLGLRIAGRISKGIRIGRDTGFDSGSTLDYVYRNEPQGLGPLGRMVDRLYLSSVGWRGIRQRKLHVEELLRNAMLRLKEAGRPVRIVDIAAGHGRYVLDALHHSPVRPDSILLRDDREINVEGASRLIAEKALGDVAEARRGDAFDRDSLADIEPTPTLAIVSGLYELFPDNGMIQWSLDGLKAAIPPGGYLIYTGQPWHPQLEFIARTLTSHRDGQAWIMRRRTQVELDQLVAAAGFHKIEQRVDEWGIFTVSLARRVAG